MNHRIFALLTLIALGFLCSCDCEDDPIYIVTCEYTTPLADTEYSYSNGDTSFSIYIQNYTAEINTDFVISQPLDVQDGIPCATSFACMDSSSYTGPFSGDYPNSFLLPEAANYYTEGVLDKSQYMLDLQERIDDYGYPRFLCYSAYYADGFSDSDENFSHAFQTLLRDFDSNDHAQRNIGYHRWYTQVRGHESSRTVNGVQYSDVIEVLLHWEMRPLDIPSDQLIVDEAYQYWFAKGIGMIETTDGDWSLQPL